MKFRSQDVLSKLQRYLFLLTIFFLPTQLGKHFWPSFAIVSGARVDYLSPTIYFTDLLIVLLIVCWFLWNRDHKRRYVETQNLASLRGWVGKPKTLFLIAGILFLSTISAKQPLASVYGIVKLLEFSLFGFITSRLLRDKKLFSQTIFVFAASMLLQSGLAIAQFFNHGSIGGLLYFLGERTFTSDTPGIANTSINGALVLRPYGTLPHPNVLAGYLLLGIALLLSIKKKLFLTLVLSFVALLLTLSRVAIVLGVILLVIHLFKILNIENSLKIKNLKFKIVLVVFVICTIGSTLWLSPLPLRFLCTSLNEEAVSQRQELIGIALRMIQGHPLFGVGLQNFIIQLPVYEKQSHTTLLLQPVHNIFLLVAAETGLIGLSLFCWFLWNTTSIVLRRPHPTPLLIGEGKFRVILLMTVFILGLFDHYFLTLQQGRTLFAFILGLCLVPFRTLRLEKLTKRLTGQANR